MTFRRTHRPPEHLLDDWGSSEFTSSFHQSLVHEPGVVEVHDPRAASDREARLAITSAIGKWKTLFPQGDARLVDYRD